MVNMYPTQGCYTKERVRILPELHCCYQKQPPAMDLRNSLLQHMWTNQSPLQETMACFSDSLKDTQCLFLGSVIVDYFLFFIFDSRSEDLYAMTFLQCPFQSSCGHPEKRRKDVHGLLYEPKWNLKFCSRGREDWPSLQIKSISCLMQHLILQQIHNWIMYIS